MITNIESVCRRFYECDKYIEDERRKKYVVFI